MTTIKIDRRKIRTRQLLRDALIALIIEKGYDTLTVQDITDRANLGRATFYLHYADKDELLTNVLEAMFDDLVAEVDYSRPEDFQHPLGLRAFQHVQQYHGLYKVLLNENVPFVVKRVRSYLASQTQRSLEMLLPDTSVLPVPAPIIASHVAGSLYSMVVWWLENDMPYPPEYMSRAFMRLILPGLPVPPETGNG